MDNRLFAENLDSVSSYMTIDHTTKNNMACRYTRWDHSSTVWNIVNRLMYECLEPEESDRPNISNPSLHAKTFNYTEISNIPLPHRHTRWDLWPTAKARKYSKEINSWSFWVWPIQ